jgi:hypothetical protein
MNLKKLAVMTMLLGALGFAGTTAAQAAPFHTLSCAEGYEPADDSMTDCVAIEDITATDETTAPDDTVDGCWVTEDGTDVCARTGVIEEPMPYGVDETPVPTPECSTAGPDVDSCIYIDSACTDVEACPEIMMNKMEDGITPISSILPGRDNSSYLIVLGLITAALGAVAIGLNRMEFGTKKK